MAGIREEGVGILQYANDAPGLSAILKQRYTDFKVNEVDMRGEVVRLTSLQASAQETDVAVQPKNTTSSSDTLSGFKPETDTDKPAEQGEEIQGSGHLQATLTPYVVCGLEEFQKLAGSEAAGKLRQMMLMVSAFEQGGARGPPPSPIFLDPHEDKEQRRQLHHFFKRPGFTNMVTDTLMSKYAEDEEKKAGGPGVSSIRIAYKASRKRRRQVEGGGRGQEWPGGDKEYTRFVLHKENMDTQGALTLLGRYLHLHFSAFGVAGTKDKRAATVQQVTLHKVAAFRLANLNSRLRGLQLGNFEYVPHRLHLGSLSGNLFDLILRNVSGSPADVARAADSLRKSGFINYFGLQRFGNEAAATHKVGALLVKGEWEAAVRMIMSHREGERPQNVEARALYLDKGDAAGAAAGLQSHLLAERAVMLGLQHHGANNYVNALLQIPRSLRSMFLHALQSYLWNRAASQRVLDHGIQLPVVGDLVLPPNTTDGPVLDEGVAEGEEVDNGPASLRRLAEVHVLSKQDIESGKFSIEDVVLPLLGASTIYPQNSAAQVYKDVAQEEGVSLDSCPHNVKEFSLTALPGDYRHLMHRPSDLAYQLLAYSDPQEELGYTDLDQVRGKSRPAVTILDAGSEVSDGKFLALQLKFKLPPSGYATMLVRELLKETTDVAQHKARTLAERGSIHSAIASQNEAGDIVADVSL